MLVLLLMVVMMTTVMVKLTVNSTRSSLESNLNILENECDIRKLVIREAEARAHCLYLGLDISTHSTGYTVLSPGTAVSSDISSCTDEEAFLREKLGASVVEWGCIVGSGKRVKDKKDVVDVGIIIEERLKEVASRCGGRCEDDEAAPALALAGSPHFVHLLVGWLVAPSRCWSIHEFDGWLWECR